MVSQVWAILTDFKHFQTPYYIQYPHFDIIEHNEEAEIDGEFQPNFLRVLYVAYFVTCKYWYIPPQPRTSNSGWYPSAFS